MFVANMSVPAVTPRIVRWSGLLVGYAMLQAQGFAQANPTPSGPGPDYFNIGKDNELQRTLEREKSDRDMRENERLDRDLRDRWIDDNQQNLKSLVFLPPLAPALSAAKSDLPALPYPVALADYAGEPFFMAHGSLQFRRLLKSPQVQPIEKYRIARDLLVGDLRSGLAAAAKLPPEQSRQVLAELTAKQEPELHTLEAEAESIRAKLSAMDAGHALFKLRDILKPEQSAGLRDYFSAIHAAQFQDGLSLDQRQLLHEIALGSLLGAPTETGPPVFFLPFTARVHQPDDPPAALASLLLEFQGLRDALKTELRQHVVNQSTTPAAGNLTKQHAAVAAQQAPRFDELHRLAERIRNASVGLACPDQPSPSDFPPELVRQVGSVATRKNALQALTQRRFRELSLEFAPERLKLAFRGNLPAIDVLPPAKPDDKPKANRDKRIARLQKCNEELQREYRALSGEMETARVEVQRYRVNLGGDNAPDIGKLSAQLAQTYAREENWRRFGDYYIAVLQPGLSPVQRRLLFNAALRDLEKHRLASTD